MPELVIVPQIFKKLDILEHVAQGTTELGFVSRILNCKADLKPFFDPSRGQYDAVKIMQQFEQDNPPLTLICSTVDLFIPIFTFVFGLAKLNGRVAIISSHRLNNKYYGLPEDDYLLGDRLLKEAIHELGHLAGLRHCPQYNCVMASSATMEDIDVKSNQFCTVCREQFDSLLFT